MNAKMKTCLFLVLFSTITLPGPMVAETGYQFGFLSFIKGAYDAYNKVKNFLNPDPNLADLITQAKNEIINEINLVRAEEQIGNVNALIDEYTIYLNNPPSQQTIEAWIRDAINVVNQFEIIIQTKSPRIAYYSAKAYNMLIPLLAIMMQREGINTEDILPLFEDMITTNKLLIGEYCWEEMPNAPLYWDVIYGSGDYVGKLLQCYQDGIIDQAEYENIYNIVWSANEEVRKYTIERYSEIWYYISSESAPENLPISPEDNQYLYATCYPKRAIASVSVGNLRPEDTDFLWRLEFVTPHQARIVHWSGKYLVAHKTADNNKVFLSPGPSSYSEIWTLNPRLFYNHDRITIACELGGEYWLYASGDSAKLKEKAYHPGNGGKWIIHYAARKGLSVGSSAFPCPADYDGDGKTDLGLKLDDGRWLIDYANNGFGAWDQTVTFPDTLNQFCQPAPADFDGDGKADICSKNDWTGNVSIDYATNGFGTWDYTRHITSSRDFALYYLLPADYDGDGKADIALYRNTGGWSIDYSSDGFEGWNTYPHGWTLPYPAGTTYPAPGDYDGDGKTDVAIKSDDRRWLIDYALNDFSWTNEWDADFSIALLSGIYGLPVTGNYTFDNPDAEMGILRLDLGQWYTWDIMDGENPTFVPGLYSNLTYDKTQKVFPAPADYDGDGMTDISIVLEDGTWLIDYSGNGYKSGTWDLFTNVVISTFVDSNSDNNHPRKGASDYNLVNYPNPFNSSTTISYVVRRPGHAVIKIYNIKGEEIRTLVDGRQDIGDYQITWNGRDRFANIVSTGVYICQIRIQDEIRNIKMLILR